MSSRDSTKQEPLLANPSPTSESGAEKGPAVQAAEESLPETPPETTSGDESGDAGQTGKKQHKISPYEYPADYYPEADRTIRQSDYVTARWRPRREREEDPDRFSYKLPVWDIFPGTEGREVVRKGDK